MAFMKISTKLLSDRPEILDLLVDKYGKYEDISSEEFVRSTLFQGVVALRFNIEGYGENDQVQQWLYENQEGQLELRQLELV